MKLLTPKDIAELTGLGYGKALLLMKAMNYIQIGNRYYVSKENFKKFVTQDTPVMLTEEPD